VSVESEKRSDAAKGFQRQRYAVVRNFVEPNGANHILEASRGLPERRVHCGVDNIGWTERIPSPGHETWQFFELPGVVHAFEAISGIRSLGGVHCWLAMYRAAEYINPHRDSEGLLQAIVCLEAPRSEANGGILFLEKSPVFLTPGDALVFEATTVEHHTSPLASTADDVEPARTVLIGRYYAGTA
jgi:hypothetical protein